MRIFHGAACLIALLIVPTVHAQATRTWVSGVGDDANPCSRTAPCKTFAGAISKTAANGEIDALDAGSFGAVTITKSITIDGGPGVAGILAAGTTGVVVNTPSASDVVVLRNLEINGAKTGISGIRFLGGGHLQIENVRVSGFSQFGIEFRPNASSNLLVNNSSIRSSGMAGISVTPLGSANTVATVVQSVVDHNYRGIKAGDGASVAVRNSTLSNNASDGIAAISSARSARVVADNTIMSGNAFAGANAMGTLASVSLSHSTATMNQFGISSTGGGRVLSFGTNRLIDNTVSDGTFSSTFGEE